jgi:hypothetical protein
MDKHVTDMNAGANPLETDGVGLAEDWPEYVLGLENASPLHANTVKMLRSMDAYLVALGALGNDKSAREASGVARRTLTGWRTNDEYGFLKRETSARVEFGHTLEAIAFDRVNNPAGNRGSDVLLLGLLNANLPDKYRRDSGRDIDDSAQRLLDRLRSGSSPSSPPVVVVSPAVVRGVVD